MKSLKIAITSLVFAGLCQTIASAKVVYVNAAAAPGGNGTSWPTACRFLQDALDQTLAGDEVWVAAGTYYPDDGASVTTGDRAASFTLKQDVKIFGGFGGGEAWRTQRNPEANVTILSGEIWAEKIYWSIHVVTLSGDALIDGFTVTRGNANGDAAPFDQGGGIWVPSSKKLTVKSCTLTNNSAKLGGAVHCNTSSQITATNCTFSGNTASSDGGAIFTAGSITTTNCTFSGNTASVFGGAIYNSGSTINATNCTFSGNAANSAGGAICTTSLALIPLECTFCTFFQNTSNEGGAIFTGNRSTTVTNCTFSENTSRQGGGAFCTQWGSITTTNCTFFGNAGKQGGALSLRESICIASINNCTFLNNLATGTGNKGGGVFSCGRVKLFNGIFWHAAAQSQSNLIYITGTGSLRNSDADFPSPLNQSVNILKGGMSAIIAEPGASVSLGDFTVKVLSEDPLFVDAANPLGEDGVAGTADDGLRLLETSPAIDLGLSMFLPVDAYDLDNDADVTEPLPVDLAGYTRIQRAALDLGAYEVGDAALPVGIVYQPLSLTVLKYLEATFTVTASGYGLRYQWYLGNSGDTSQPVAGATGNSYTTPEMGSTASYWVRVENSLGFVDSQTATATIVPLIIATQPASTVTAIGGTATLTVSASGKGLSYQWYQGASGDTSHPLDGANQPGFTTPALFATTAFWVRITGEYGAADSDAATVAVVADPVAEALNKESLMVFTAGGNASWFSQSATTRDGFAAGQSGVIAHSQTSSVQTSVAGAGTLSFWWRVSSQSGGDYLRFYIDGVEQSGSISGTTGNWTQKTFQIATAGSHTFKWSYTKNSSTSSGSDCGWVDEVMWNPKLITTQPANQYILSGTCAQLGVSTIGTNLSYQWFSGGSGVTTSPVSGATGPILTTPALYASNQYWVKVGNGIGFESSAAATVTVFPPDSSVASALNSGETLSFFTRGDMPWFEQSSTTHDGVSALKSGAISHAQSSMVEGLTSGNGTLSFWWKVSSELGCDFCIFYIDDVERGRLSGETDWQQAIFHIPSAGQHKLKWVYVKDESKTTGSDCAWLDQVSWKLAADATTYQAWLGGFDLTGLNAHENANPAGDGVSNLVKYALRLNPRATTLAQTDGIHAGLPLMERVGDSMRFTFIKDTGKSDISYTVESCGDLSTWEPVTTGVVETPLEGTLIRVEVTIPITDQGFCRLRVGR